MDEPEAACLHVVWRIKTSAAPENSVVGQSLSLISVKHRHNQGLSACVALAWWTLMNGGSSEDVKTFSICTNKSQQIKLSFIWHEYVAVILILFLFHLHLWKAMAWPDISHWKGQLASSGIIVDWPDFASAIVFLNLINHQSDHSAVECLSVSSDKESTTLMSY